MMFLFLFFAFLQAQIISPSAVELDYQLEAEFVTTSEDTSDDLALFHLQHLFGIFHSQNLTETFGLSYADVEGLGGLQLPTEIIVQAEDILQDHYRIRYKAKGSLIMHREIAKQVVKDGGIWLPLPYELDKFYLKKCTDSYYSGYGDFWYFYDPFRRGCERFRQEPLARDVFIKMHYSNRKKNERSPNLKAIRGNNRNGSRFVISMLNGFAENSRYPLDEGRISFERLNAYLVDLGFKQKQIRWLHTSPMYIYEKRFSTADGPVDVVIERLLVDSEISARSKVFAKYFKEAMESSDIIIYGGHSGLGGNLDIPALEDKAGGPIRFDQRKKQIAFFDSCSSYSYYLASFRDTKRRSSIDIMTYGLNSYFETSFDVHTRFLDLLLDFEYEPSWMELLKELEAPLDGATYLLSVGGI